jgi:formate hydrogenlyase subunit 6/NADH:ubiquinone oxidoreductase subunit I
MGKCLFCVDCVEACKAGAIEFSGDYRLAVSRRETLVVREGQKELELARSNSASSARAAAALARPM